MRVAVIARYPALRAGLRAILAAERIEVVAEASTVGDLARDPEFGEVDVALVDPGADFDGRELDAMMRDSPSLRPVLLGPIQHAELLSASLDGRAWGYLRREADGDVLAAAVRAVAAGLVVVERDLTRNVIAAPAPARHLLDDALPEELSPRELEVLQLVAEGLANKMIAARLRISEHTVKFHVASILGKLGAASRTEASHTAARRGLVAL